MPAQAEISIGGALPKMCRLAEALHIGLGSSSSQVDYPKGTQNTTYWYLCSVHPLRELTQ